MLISIETLYNEKIIYDLEPNQKQVKECYEFTLKKHLSGFQFRTFELLINSNEKYNCLDYKNLISITETKISDLIRSGDEHIVSELNMVVLFLKNKFEKIL